MNLAALAGVYAMFAAPAVVMALLPLQPPEFRRETRKQAHARRRLAEDAAFLLLCIEAGNHQQECEMERLMESGGMNVNPAARSRMGVLA